MKPRFTCDRVIAQYKQWKVLTCCRKKPQESAGGFTLLEVIIVIGMVAFVYSVAIPNFNLRSGNEVASKLGQLAEDIRSAYDYSVLTGKPYRLVFKLQSGDYWLEGLKEGAVSTLKIGNAATVSDPSPEQEQERIADFEENFNRYVDIVGESVENPESGEDDIEVVSPIILAKEKLKGPVWEKMDTLEWSGRNIGPYLIIRDLQTTHHEQAVSIEEGPDTIAMMYFLPQGFVERTVMHVFYLKDEAEIDPGQTPYTIFTHPFEGYAEVQVGHIEIDVFSETQGSL